ncbi:hypothetical protein QZH41_000580 [Actinostola sp. cb2023]|nr:hypothetical protein QZH41_000580 [Actinostola sp. cb2023]
MEMEQLKFKQDLIRQEEEMKLKRQILEAQYKVEKAKLQVEIFEEDEDQQHSIKRDQPPKDHLDYQLKQECANEPQQLHCDKERQDAMMNALSRVVHLPKPDLQTFNGDPLDFCSFTSVFDNYIERNASSDSERLIYLLQYTSGDAKRVIKGCSMMNPAKGYQTARKLLKERFGHPYVIAAKCVNKLTDGPAIKPSDRVGQLNFADELTECQNLLESIGYLEEINSADNLRRIVQRLPFNLKSRFIDLADTLQQSGKRTNISHIAEFVKTKARAANNPVFGTIVDAYPETRRSKPNAKPEAQHHGQHRVTSLNTSVSREQNNSHSRPSYSDVQTCPACKGSHQLKGCHKFTNMSFEDRFKIMRSCNLCNNCFKQGHIALGCLEKKSCEVEGCTRRHHTLLHHPNSSTPVNDSSSKETIPTVAQAHNISNVQPSESSERICLRIVPVKVKGPTKSVITYALLDNGSDVSLCEKDLAAQIGVRGEEKSYYLTTQEKKNSRKVGQYLTGLTVESLDDGNRLNIPKLWTVDNLNVASHSIPSNADVKRWPHLYDVNLLDIEDKKVKLIIGSNVPEAFWVMEERRGNKGEPYAIRSPFGWTLFGPTNSTNNQPLHHMVNVIQEKEQQENSDTLLQQLQQFWKIEHGIASPDVKASMSVEDKHALSIMNKSVKLVDNHYQIGLPWKQDIPYLPNNRCLAEQRLKSLKKIFLRDEELFDKYKSTVLDYIGKGHARRVPEQEVNVQDKPLWYLPHHPVFNPNKPNKTRVVFDCAARFKETSLNDQLLSGPDLTNTIVGVLTRFRQEEVALAADIECMFHQVKVTPDDYDAFRFLWWRDNDLHKDLVDYRMEVHLFGATSSPSCASYALRRTAEDNKDQYNKDIVSTVEKNFYVDDCLKSVKSTDEAVTLTILSMPAIQSSSGMSVLAVDFSDPQGGKGPADRMSATCKNHIRRYINEGHDVTKAQQMKDAILSYGGLQSVRVAVVETIEEAPSELTKIPGINKLNNFCLMKRVLWPDGLMGLSKESGSLQLKDVEVHLYGL